MKTVAVFLALFFAMSSFSVSARDSAWAPVIDQIQNRLDALELRDDDLEGRISVLEVGPVIPPSADADWLGYWANDLWADIESWLARPVWVAHYKTPFKVGGLSWALGDKQKGILEAWTTLSPHVQLAIILDIYPAGGGTDPRFAEIVAGRWDIKLSAYATRLIETGHEDAILRLWHEPELAFRKWCEDPDYIAAWQRVHDLFMAQPGAAFTWQYSVNGPSGNQLRSSDGTLWIDKCYPGAFYVDQVSMSAYDRNGATADDSWRVALAKLVFVRDWALAQGHRFSIAEWGLWHPDCKHSGQGDNPSFIQRSHDFFAAIPEESRGYMLYFARHRCVDLDQFPESKALFERLFGGL